MYHGDPEPSGRNDGMSHDFRRLPPSTDLCDSGIDSWKCHTCGGVASSWIGAGPAPDQPVYMPGGLRFATCAEALAAAVMSS